MPEICAFCPEGAQARDDICMTVDEYDVIRLKDYEGLSQDEIARRMGVARSTVQRVYDEARHKLAECLVSGKRLRIEGGDYRLCEGQSGRFNCGGCRCVRHDYGSKARNAEKTSAQSNLNGMKE